MRTLRLVARLVLLGVLFPVSPLTANELWVAPTYQQDVGGLGIGSNGVWPVTAAGAVRLAWGVPGDLHAFGSARIALVPRAPAGAATLTVYVCRAASSDLVGAACSGPVAHNFVGVANRLIEVDVSAAIAPRVGAPGVNYLGVLAYTTPTTGTDHILGLRFTYSPTPAATEALADSAVTGAKVAPGVIDQSKLAFDPATQAELNGAIAAVRIRSLGDLAGLACQHNGQDGTTAFAVESDGRVSLKCNVPTCCTLGQPAWDALAQFVMALPAIVMPTPFFSSGECGLFDAGCVRIAASASGVNATSRIVTAALVDERPEWTDYRLTREVTITTPTPLTAQYKNVGPDTFNTCMLSITGTRSLTEIVRSEVVPTSLGTYRRLSRPIGSSSTLGNLTFSGCSLVRDSVIAPVYQALHDFVKSQVAFRFCWPDGTTQYGTCPAS
jgi:hypothetical protein